MKSPTAGLRSTKLKLICRALRRTLAALYVLPLVGFALACQNHTSTAAEATTEATTQATSAPAQGQTATANSLLWAEAAPSDTVPAAARSVSEPPTSIAPKTSRATDEKTAAKETKPVANKPAEAKPSAPAATVAAPAEKPTVDKPCLSKTFEFSTVKAACDKGGVPQAKALMKTWTNKAKEKGGEYKCTTCHDNQRTYSNTPNAAADLRKLLNEIK